VARALSFPAFNDIAKGARTIPQPQTRIALQTKNMRAVLHSTEQPLGAIAQRYARENHWFYGIWREKTRKTQPKTKAAASTG